MRIEKFHSLHFAHIAQYAHTLNPTIISFRATPYFGRRVVSHFRCKWIYCFIRISSVRWRRFTSSSSSFFPILFLLLLTERLTIFCSCRTLGVRSHSLFHIAFFSISWNPTTANCHDAHNYELFYENLLPAMAAQKCSRNAETFWNFNTQHTFSTFRIFFLLHWLDFSKVVNASRTSSVWTNWRQFIDAFCCTLNPSEVDSVAAGQLSQVWRAYAWIEWQFEINT